MTEPEDKIWTFWDALTNANPDWWDCNNDDEDEEDDDETNE
ncbi:hypothetical protein [Pseudanabaena cinerea]|nr:hypothetical protein [Pseudanabaena cinerea]